jgi:Asp-tRNA(Asn)/Glu-tRNA(Gln) amidotransferase A subunit family amidase
MDLCALTGRELQRLLDDEAIRVVDIAAAYLERISQRDGRTGAWAHVDPDHVLEQAHDLDASPDRPPLRGIPIGVKDSIETFDLPTSYGSPVYRGHRPSRDADLVERLRRSGALLLGKTSTTEFMSPFGPPARNPLDPSRSPGTSSSGSAASVADQTAPVTIGTQSGGSIIRPASYCGVYGYKGRTNDVPRGGIYPLRPTFDSVGLFARGVSDIELVWPAIADAHAAPSPSTEPVPDAVGLVRPPWLTREDSSSAEVSKLAAESLTRAGYRVIELELPPSFRSIPEVFAIISGVELAAGLASHLEKHPGGISDHLAARVRHGQGISDESFAVARDSVARMKEEVFELLASAEAQLIVTASASGEAPQDLTSAEDSNHHYLASLLDLSAMSIPFGHGPNGMPVGVQIMCQSSLIAPGSDTARRLDRALHS